MKENKNTNISVKNMDTDTWRKFQAECILRQKSAGIALQEAIEQWLKTKKQ